MSSQFIHSLRTATAFAAALWLAACTSATPEATEPPVEATEQTVTLKTVMLPFMSFAPISIAYEEGYFREQGIELEFIELDQSIDALPLLAQGDLDVLAGSPNAGLFQLMAQGEPIKLVADKGYINPDGECDGSLIVGRTDLLESGELDSAEDLAGRTIVVETGEITDYTMHKVLESGGVSPDDVQWMSVPLPAMIDAFQQGSIDVQFVGEPWTSRVLASGAAQKFIDPGDIIPNTQIAYIIYGQNLLIDYPEVGERFMTAYLKGVRQYLEGKTDRNVELVAAHTGLEVDFLQQACWPDFRADGQISVESAVDFQNWAQAKGYLDETVPADVFWDARFVDYANGVLSATTP